MPNYPAARLLVPPEPPDLPDGFTMLQSPMVNGVPHNIDLPNGTRLVIALPIGLLADCIAADPAALVASSDDEIAPRPAEAGTETGGVARVPLRLSARRSGAPLGTMAFSLRTSRLLRDDGDTVTGTTVEIVLLAWQIHAGTLRGAGDFGSSVTLAWRWANLGSSDFGPPVINPFLVLRLPPILRIRSELGLRVVRIDTKFQLQRRALYEPL